METPTEADIAVKMMFRTLAVQMSALSQETRMAMMMALGIHGRATPSQLAAMCDIPLTASSHHLQILKRADLVWDEQEGKERFYQIHPRVALHPEHQSEVFRWQVGPLKIVHEKVPEPEAAKVPEPEAKPKKGGRGRGK